MATRGIIAVGDSIINGFTYSVMVPTQSWALWVAQAAGMDFTRLSIGGADSTDVVTKQLPLMEHDDYDVAGLTMGANDVLIHWDEARYAANLNTALTRLTACARRVVVSNLPSNFRQLPGAPPHFRTRTASVNRIIDEAVLAHGVDLLDVRDLAGMRLTRADRVHPSAVGMLEMGDRAARLLGVEPLPSSTLVGAPQLARLTPKIVAAYWMRFVESTGRVVVKRAIGKI